MTSKDPQTARYFPPLAIERISEANRINRVMLMLIWSALACFVVFGTVASLPAFHKNTLIYWGFHYVPYILVALTILPSLYQTFVIHRYRLCQPSMLAISIGLALSLTTVCLLFALQDWLWLGMSAWIGVAFWFKAVFKRFDKFLLENKTL